MMRFSCFTTATAWPRHCQHHATVMARYLSSSSSLPSSSFKVAIVGSGPSGCYTAKYLQAAWKKAGKGTPQIDVIERLPTPYGLVR